MKSWPGSTPAPTTTWSSRSSLPSSRFASTRCCAARRSRALTGALRRGRLEIDRDARSVRVDGKVVRLPPKPLRLLELLAERADKVFAHEELERAIWGNEALRAEALRTLVAATRRLFAQAGCGLDPIETLHGHGYRLRGQ